MDNNKMVKKIFGAIFSSVAIGIFFLAMVVTITYYQLTEEVGMPNGVYIFTMCLFGIPLLGIVISLITRIREILGGEEDEATNY